MEQEKDSASLLTEPQAAEMLGVCAGTLKQARLGYKSSPLYSLPYVSIGRAIRYKRSDVIDWIDKHTVHP